MDNTPSNKLEQTEQQLRPLIENATDIITVLNRDGTRRRRIARLFPRSVCCVNAMANGFTFGVVD